MKLIILALTLVVASTPTYALTHEQKKARAQHHAHLHELHRENKILQMWMATSERSCTQYTGPDFRSCYISTLKSLRDKNPNVKFSPETQDTFDKIVRTFGK
jgi:hypothetical protein